VLVVLWWWLPEVTVVACGVLAGNLQLDLAGGLMACGLGLTIFDVARSRDHGAGFAFLRWGCGLGWVVILSLVMAALGTALVGRLAPVVGPWPGLAATILILFGAPNLLLGIATLLSIAGAFVVKILYWRRVSKDDQNGPTAESATGLGRTGLVRMLDPPHTQTNYLLDELGFQIGRKHARILRMLTLLFGLFLPLALTLIALTLDGWLQALLASLALALGMIGVLLERWLFFAEARHTVMLYYGFV